MCHVYINGHGPVLSTVLYIIDNQLLTLIIKSSFTKASLFQVQLLIYAILFTS